MTQREQGRDKEREEGQDELARKREPRPSDRERDEEEVLDRDQDPGVRRTERDPGDEDDDSEEEEGSSAARQELTEEEKEERRVRRRQEKKEKRERERRERDELRETVRRQGDEIRRLNERQVRGEHQGRAQRIEDDLSEVDSVIATLRNRRKKAIEAVDPDAIDDLDDKLYRARRRKDDLLAEQENLKRQPRGPVASDELISNANRFMREHSWYDASQGTDDEDSLIVQAIDRKLHRAGRLDPNSTAYWEELRKQVREHPRLKHRFGGRARSAESEDEDEGGEERANGGGTKRGGPPVGGRGSGPSRDGFVLTEEHKHALREAGIEPGTERYSKMIDSFKKAHKAQREARA